MKVLWFEISPPSKFDANKTPEAGWQDALEDIVSSCPNIELGVAFEYLQTSNKKIINGVTYYPMTPHYTFFEKQKNKKTWEIHSYKLIQLSLKVINDFKPDVIHIFGSEWPFGLIAKHTQIPVVIHMQGSIPPYNNAMYPPTYSELDERRYLGLNIRRQYKFTLGLKKAESRKLMEEEILRTVQNYMGRTHWDKDLVNLYNPTARYFHCEEALRSSFLKYKQHWQPQNNSTIRLFSIGCGSFWKGMDTVLKTAVLLKERNINFEWNIAGKMIVKKIIEFKEKKQYSDYNIKILGFVSLKQIQEYLLSSDLYIHTAYIDNSPNAICEAQYIGTPIIATFVGGIPSLIENNKDGLLIPANDPYTLASSIIKLSEDKDQQLTYSKAGQEKAIKRHDRDAILKDLIACYTTLINFQ